MSAPNVTMPGAVGAARADAAAAAAAPFAPLRNGVAVPLSSLPTLGIAELGDAVVAGTAAGLRVSALFGAFADAESGPVTGPAGRADAPIQIFAVLADDAGNRLLAARATVAGESFPSIAARCPQAQLFEREIAEQFGLRPEGHPWMKPVRYRRSWTGRDAWGRDPGSPIAPAVGDFYRVEGEQVHEVAVGPVHAGVIEPGHFRFQCHGETVFHLEIALGYQHRGIEEALTGGPDLRSLRYAETAAGDATIAHATSYCQAIEALAGIRVPARAQALAGIALELERLACHVGDLGALSGDVAYLPTASFCGRIRGDLLNMSALLCGSRFGRGMMRPGGVAFDMDPARIDELRRRLDLAERDAAGAINLLWDSQSVMARFEGTGVLPREVAAELGIVGPAARASGLVRDVRADQPAGLYRMAQVPVSTYDAGDVLGRAYVRWLEIQQSVAFIRDQLGSLPGGPVLAEAASPAPGFAPRSGHAPAGLAAASLAVTLNEGWRGEVCHAALTDGAGRLARYKIVDPSFHNWQALAYVLRGQEISDFPLCNKSFNLSYCGHDL